MALRFSLDSDLEQVIILEEKQQLRRIILNRPLHLNSLTYGMLMQIKKALEEYEVDDTVGILILTGQGKSFCAGGDIAAYFQVMTAGHWSLSTRIYKKQLLLQHKIAKYKKPLVMVMNGMVMGGGAGLAMSASYRIATENTVFGMPEVFLGSFADVGISYFFSRLSGYYGEYLGLTGARISGIEMLATGLATHFVFSKDLKSLENELSMTTHDIDGAAAIMKVLQKFMHKPNLKPDTAFARLDIINKCFSKKTVEDILSSLESEVEKCGEEWIVKAMFSMKSAASPTSLKICLKNIREARNSSSWEECLKRDYTIFRHVLRRKFSRDINEGARSIVIDKDRRPKWKPMKLEEVSEEVVKQFFQDNTIDDDEDWDCSLEFDEINHSKKYSKL